MDEKKPIQPKFETLVEDLSNISAAKLHPEQEMITGYFLID